MTPPLRLFVVCCIWAGVASAQAPAFDVVSVKPVSPDDRRGIDFRFYPDRFVATLLTLEQLICQAYDIQPRELSGGPDWMRTDRFNVTATTGSEVPRERMRLMIQTMLADRFKLQIAKETQTGTVYTLTANALKNLKPPANTTERSRIALIRHDENGYLSYTYDAHNTTIMALTQSLASQLRAPVTDETGISGNFDFAVNYSYDSAFGGLEPDPNVPTIFTALSNQLGLKLTAGKGLIPIYVVRTASRPTPD